MSQFNRFCVKKQQFLPNRSQPQDGDKNVLKVVLNKYPIRYALDKINSIGKGVICMGIMPGKHINVISDKGTTQWIY